MKNRFGYYILYQMKPKSKENMKGHSWLLAAEEWALDGGLRMRVLQETFAWNGALILVAMDWDGLVFWAETLAHGI